MMEIIRRSKSSLKPDVAVGRAAFFLSILLLWSSGTAVAENQKIDALSVAPFSFSPSLDTTAVQVRTYGVNWSIPRNFLDTARLAEDRDVSGQYSKSAVLRIILTFPDFFGATRATLHCFSPLSTKNCPNIIVVHILPTNDDLKVRNGPAIDEAAVLSRDDGFDLTKVKAKTGLGPQDVYVYYGGTPEKSVVISCLETDGLNGCTVRLKLFDIPVLYQYERKLLPHWRQIHDQVSRRLESFHVGDVQ